MVMAKKKVRTKRRAAPVATAERWTEARRDAFLVELAQTASVAGAARKVGVPERSPYYLRRRDPAFRAAWDEAIDEGYAKLELLLLERATYGQPLTLDGEAAPTIPTTLALALLKSHHAKARRGPSGAPRPMRGGALRDALENKLAGINRRLGGNG